MLYFTVNCRYFEFSDRNRYSCLLFLNLKYIYTTKLVLLTCFYSSSNRIKERLIVSIKVTIVTFSGPQHLLRSVFRELLKSDEGSETQYLGNRPFSLFPVSTNSVLLCL